MNKKTTKYIIILLIVLAVSGALLTIDATITGRTVNTNTYYCCGATYSTMTITANCEGKPYYWRWNAEYGAPNACWYTTCESYCNIKGFDGWEISDDEYTCVCGGDTSSSPPSSGANCTDTDGGRIYDVFGTVTLSNGSVFNDSCAGNQLSEYTCDVIPGIAQYSLFVYDCTSEGKICQNGACVEEVEEPCCIDTDGGLNYYVEGFARSTCNPTYTTAQIDICREPHGGGDVSNMIEGVCAGNEVRGVPYECPHGCANNTCVCVADSECPSGYGCVGGSCTKVVRRYAWLRFKGTFGESMFGWLFNGNSSTGDYYLAH